MKIKKAIALGLVMSITGCVYEPPPVFYTFIITNNSDHEIYIQSKTVKDTYVCYDTLVSGQEYKREIMKLQCYDDYYKDTLVAALFKKLEITTSAGKVNIDPYKRNNWKEKLELHGSNNCKSGYAYYLLGIYNHNCPLKLD